MSGEPFNRCTHTALSPQGDIYIAYVSFLRSFPDIPKPARIRCLQKLVKVTAGIKTQE